MVHSVGDKMDDDAAQCLSLGVVERVSKRLVEPLLVHDFTGELDEPDEATSCRSFNIESD